jgi:hypothetical protein
MDVLQDSAADPEFAVAIHRYYDRARPNGMLPS